MAPIALPQNSPIPVPQAPSDPPTVNDFHRAWEYRRSIESGMFALAPNVTATHLTDAHAYETKILMGRSNDVAPPWLAAALQPIQNELRALRDDIGELRDSLGELQDDLLDFRNETRDSLAKIRSTSTKTHNKLSAEGTFYPYEEVPFVDNSLPTEAPHDLPLLHSEAAVDGLTGPQATSYFQGYYPAQVVPHTVAARLLAIKRAIGCTRGTTHNA
ncbi:hypothetical protein BKA93DRAFT_795519 [Sparassis latifolia]